MGWSNLSGRRGEIGHGYAEMRQINFLKSVLGHFCGESAFFYLTLIGHAFAFELESIWMRSSTRPANVWIGMNVPAVVIISD